MSFSCSNSMSIFHPLTSTVVRNVDRLHTIQIFEVPIVEMCTWKRKKKLMNDWNILNQYNVSQNCFTESFDIYSGQKGKSNIVKQVCYSCNTHFSCHVHSFFTSSTNGKSTDLQYLKKILLRLRMSFMSFYNNQLSSFQL